MSKETVISVNKLIPTELVSAKSAQCACIKAVCHLFQKVSNCEVSFDSHDLVCGMASSERRGKMNIATRLESDRLVITVNEAAQLSPMDVNGLRLVYCTVS